MASQPIPVVPAAHYLCGGIVSDLEGRTSIRRLYVSGESSCTGVHGANRLASNSLLEGVCSRHARFHTLSDLRRTHGIDRTAEFRSGTRKGPSISKSGYSSSIISRT